jgi:predicted RNA-binding Zn-ribbon protein involved in translation (DUF1610 family)
MSKTHVTLEFGQNRSKHGIYRCNQCAAKIWLIVARSWSVDQESLPPRADGPDDVDVSEEVTAHYCPKCERITSLSFNW